MKKSTTLTFFLLTAFLYSQVNELTYLKDLSKDSDIIVEGTIISKNLTVKIQKVLYTLFMN